MLNQTKRPFGLVVCDYTTRAFGFLLLLIGLLKVSGLIFPTDPMATYLNLSNAVIPVLSNRWIFCMAAALQTWVGYRALRSKVSVQSRSAYLLWVGVAVFGYKIALVYADYHGPCGCLFGLTRFLPLRTSRQNLLADFILASMLAASAIVFIWSSLAYRNTEEAIVPEPVKSHG